MKVGLKEYSKEFYELDFFDKKYKVYFSLKSKSFLENNYSMEEFVKKLEKWDVRAIAISVYSIGISSEEFTKDFVNFESFLRKFLKMREDKLPFFIEVFNKSYVASKPLETRKYLVNKTNEDLKKKKGIMKKIGL